MPALPRNVPPKLCLHEASGRACVHYRGRSRYLGNRGSSESSEAYEAFKHEWQADLARAVPARPTPEEPFTIVQLCLAYFQWADRHYRKHGQPARSIDNIKKEFDEEFSGDSFGPPTAKQRAHDRRARGKRGRPQVGMGSKTISVTVEKQLLAKTDRLAKKLNVPRAALIARGLQAVISAEAPIG